MKITRLLGRNKITIRRQRQSRQRSNYTAIPVGEPDREESGSNGALLLADPIPPASWPIRSAWLALAVLIPTRSWGADRGQECQGCRWFGHSISAKCVVAISPFQ